MSKQIRSIDKRLYSHIKNNCRFDVLLLLSKKEKINMKDVKKFYDNLKLKMAKRFKNIKQMTITQILALCKIHDIDDTLLKKWMVDVTYVLKDRTFQQKIIHKLNHVPHYVCKNMKLDSQSASKKLINIYLQKNIASPYVYYPYLFGWKKLNIANEMSTSQLF